MTVIITELTEVHRILLNFKEKTFGIHRFLCKMIVTHTSAHSDLLPVRSQVLQQRVKYCFTPPVLPASVGEVGCFGEVRRRVQKYLDFLFFKGLFGDLRGGGRISARVWLRDFL